VPELPNLDHLSHAEKDALIRALWQRLEAAERRIAELEARLGEPGKTPDNSSLPPSKWSRSCCVKKERRAPCCALDEGRSLGAALQEEASNHHERPSLNGDGRERHG
jgi:transposase